MDSYLPGGLLGSNCLGGIGTSATMSNAEENYMSVVRDIISIVTRNPGEFGLPVAQGIFGYKQGDVVMGHMIERVRKVFEHLNIGLALSFYKAQNGDVAQRTTRHCPNLVPELYVGNLLVYPIDHLGSLALILDKLGLEQLDHEYEDG
jgi:hypothetical protein